MASLRYVIGAKRSEYIDQDGRQFYAGISEYAPRAEGRTAHSAWRKFRRNTDGFYGDGFCWDREAERYVDLPMDW